MSQCAVTINLRDANGVAYAPTDNQSINYAAAEQFDTDSYRVVTSRKAETLTTGMVLEFERTEVFHFVLPDASAGYYLIPDTATADFTDLVQVATSPAPPIPTGLELVDEVAAALAGGYVPNTRTVAGHPLSSNVAITAADVGADSSGAAATAQAAAQAYADAAITAAVTGLWDDRGGYNASVNTFPASGGSGTAGAVLKGDLWKASSAGTLGGKAVAIGDLIIALVDSPGQTAGNWNLIEHDLGYNPEDVANKSTDGTLASNSDTLYPSQKAVKTAITTIATARAVAMSIALGG